MLNILYLKKSLEGSIYFRWTEQGMCLTPFKIQQIIFKSTKMNSWRTIYKIVSATELDYQTSYAEDGLTDIDLSGSVGEHWTVGDIAEFYHREVTNYITRPETIWYFSEVYI